MAHQQEESTAQSYSSYTDHSRDTGPPASCILRPFIRAMCAHTISTFLWKHAVHDCPPKIETVCAQIDPACATQARACTQHLSAVVRTPACNTSSHRTCTFAPHMDVRVRLYSADPSPQIRCECVHTSSGGHRDGQRLTIPITGEAGTAAEGQHPRGVGDALAETRPVLTLLIIVMQVSAICTRICESRPTNTMEKEKKRILHCRENSQTHKCNSSKSVDKSLLLVFLQRAK